MKDLLYTERKGFKRGGGEGGFVPLALDLQADCSVTLVLSLETGTSILLLCQTSVKNNIL